MKITKYVHSCLLVETPDKVVLFDPGNFSWAADLLKIDGLTQLDAIVITHEHTDHYHLPFVEALVKKFPEALVVTNSDLAGKLTLAGIKNPVVTESGGGFEIFGAPHEPLPLDLPVVPNVGIHFDRLTHPGDAFDFPQTKEVLALPLTAPWGSVTQALNAAVRLKPSIIIPVHDWHWHEEARQQMYGMSQSLVEPRGIKFLALENGKPVEL